MLNGLSFKVTANDRALCWCGIRIPSARNHSPAFDKDKYLEPMFDDAGQARTNAAMLLMMIATTSSHTCTKPIVTCSYFRLSKIKVMKIILSPKDTINKVKNLFFPKLSFL